MSNLHLLGIAVSIAAGCQADVSSPARPAAPQTRPVEISADAPPQPVSGARDKGGGNAEKRRITAADALRIAAARSGHKGQSRPAARAQLVSFREGYQRAWDNVHGDPDLQGPIAFGVLEDLNRDGRCWSVEAHSGHWAEITYIDEFGAVIYQFNR